MPYPYQFRDYPLAVFMGLVYLVGGIMWLTSSGYQSVEIFFGDICCTTPSCPLVESLAALPSSTNIRHQVGVGSTTVSLRMSPGMSVKQIWDAVEATKHRPLRMVVDNREYVNKPIN